MRATETGLTEPTSALAGGAVKVAITGAVTGGGVMRADAEPVPGRTVERLLAIVQETDSVPAVAADTARVVVAAARVAVVPPSAKVPPLTVAEPEAKLPPSIPPKPDPVQVAVTAEPPFTVPSAFLGERATVTDTAA